MPTVPVGSKLEADLIAWAESYGIDAGKTPQAVQNAPEKPKASQCPKDKAKATVIGPVVWKAFGVPQPVPEFRFAEPRRWRFDYAWIEQKIALEIDGGAWDFAPGRHNRRAGFVKDQEKRNSAVLLRWGVLHCTPQDVKDGSIFATIRQALKLEEVK